MHELIETLNSRLKEKGKVVYFNSNKTELMTRCPYCGDSIKDRSHAHFYIKTIPPFSFYCQRCESSGLVDDKVINDLDSNIDGLGIDFFKEIKKFTQLC